LNVVAQPCDGVGYAWVNTHCTEESSKVKYCRRRVVWHDEENEESNDTDDWNGHIENASRVILVGIIAYNNGENARRDIWCHGEKLGFRRCITKLKNDTREEH